MRLNQPTNQPCHCQCCSDIIYVIFIKMSKPTDQSQTQPFYFYEKYIWLLMQIIHLWIILLVCAVFNQKKKSFNFKWYHSKLCEMKGIQSYCDWVLAFLNRIHNWTLKWISQFESPWKGYWLTDKSTICNAGLTNRPFTTLWHWHSIVWNVYIIVWKLIIYCEIDRIRNIFQVFLLYWLGRVLIQSDISKNA